MVVADSPAGRRTLDPKKCSLAGDPIRLRPRSRPLGAKSGCRECGLRLDTSLVVTRWLVSKADASKAPKGAPLAATVLTIIKRTIDDVSMASARTTDLSEPKRGSGPAAYRRRRARNSASQPVPFEKPAARSGERVRGKHRVPQQALQGSEARLSASAR
jgi:hypothetical protein